MTTDLILKWERCLHDPTGKDIVSVWKALKDIAYGNKEGTSYQEAWRGMLALVWHPAFPDELCREAVGVDPHALPKTSHWKLHCLRDPELEYQRRMHPSMGRLTWEDGVLGMAFDPCNTRATFDDEWNKVVK